LGDGKKTKYHAKPQLLSGRTAGLVSFPEVWLFLQAARSQRTTDKIYQPEYSGSFKETNYILHEKKDIRKVKIDLTASSKNYSPPILSS
jgi:hypothetical protein